MEESCCQELIAADLMKKLPTLTESEIVAVFTTALFSKLIKNCIYKNYFSTRKIEL